MLGRILLGEGSNKRDFAFKIVSIRNNDHREMFSRLRSALVISYLNSS